MSRKSIALSTMLLSVLLVLFTIQAVTGRGVIEGQCTFYQTISTCGKYFSLSQNDQLSLQLFLQWTGIVIFAISTLLLFAPNFILFEQQNKRSIMMVFINIIGVVIEFLFFRSYSYMFMLITLCVLLACNILIQFLVGVKKRSDMVVLILTAFIGFLNVYYLFRHFIIYKQIDIWYSNGAFDRITKELIHISRINMICFAMWLIPYVILLVREIKSNKSNIKKTPFQPQQ